MAIVTKRPPIKETVGAQYICFAVESEDGVFNGEYLEEVERTEVVKSVNVTENSETTPVRASGKVYTNITDTSGTDISVEVIAFPAETRAKMRGDTVTESGLILKGGNKKPRPFFAYGKVVKLFGDHCRFDWFPKCQLSTITDDSKSKEDKFSEQNDTLSISAMAFDEDGNNCVSIETEFKSPDGLTESLFFSKPILNDEDLKAILAVSPNPENGGSEGAEV